MELGAIHVQTARSRSIDFSEKAARRDPDVSRNLGPRCCHELSNGRCVAFEPHTSNGRRDIRILLMVRCWLRQVAVFSGLQRKKTCAAENDREIMPVVDVPIKNSMSIAKKSCCTKRAAVSMFWNMLTLAKAAPEGQLTEDTIQSIRTHSRAQNTWSMNLLDQVRERHTDQTCWRQTQRCRSKWNQFPIYRHRENCLYSQQHIFRFTSGVHRASHPKGKRTIVGWLNQGHGRFFLFH